MNDRLVRWIATGAGSGLLKPASGTWGTLASAPLPMAIGLLLPPSWAIAAMLAVSGAAFYLGVGVTTRAERLFGEKDPHPVVFDEFVGYWISVSCIPFQARLREAILYGAAFFLFRALDVAKPFGIRKLQDLPGGLGIMIDDAAAGILTLVGVLCFAGVMDHTGFW